MAEQQRLNIVIGANVDQFNRALTKVQKDLGKFARKMESTGRTLTTALTIPLGLAGVAAVRTFATFDKLEKGLEALAGVAGDGKRQLKGLLDVVKDTRTTLSLEDAAKGSLQLQAIGFNAERAANTLRQLGIAATLSGGSSDDVAEVARQFSQAAAKGKILQQELRIVLERIPALASVIAKEFGTVTAEGLRDAGVSADEFISRLTKAIEQNEKFQNVQGGLAKSIETFGIEIQIAANEMGRAISESLNLEKNLKRLSDFVSRVVTGFSNWSDGSKKVTVGLALLLAGIGPILLGVSTMAKLFIVALDGAKLLVNGITGIAALANPVGIAVIAIGALAVGLIFAYQKSETFREFIEKAGKAVQVVFIAAGKVFDQFKGLAVAGFGLISSTVKAFISVSKSRFSVLVSYLQPVITVLNDIRKAVSTVAVTAGGILVAAFVGAGNSIIAGLTEIFKIASENLSSFARASELVFQGKFKQAFAALPTDIGNQAIRVGTAFKDGFNNGVEGTFKFFNDLRGAFADAEKEAAKAGATVAPALIGGATTTPGATPTTPGVNTPRSTLSVQAIPTEYTTSIQSATAGFDKLSISAQNATVQVGAFNEKAIANWREVESMGLAIDDVSGRAIPNLNSIIELGAQSFASYVQDGVSGMKDLSGAVLKSTLQIVRAFIQQGVAAAVANALKNPAGVIPPLGLALAAAAGAAASGLFGGLIRAIGVPKLAEGGLAYGPSLALVGDNQGARVDPEVISPLSKLKKLIGGGGDGAYIAEARISGQDLLILMKKAELAYNRVR